MSYLRDGESPPLATQVAAERYARTQTTTRGILTLAALIVLGAVLLVAGAVLWWLLGLWAETVTHGLAGGLRQGP